MVGKTTPTTSLDEILFTDTEEDEMMSTSSDADLEALYGKRPRIDALGRVDGKTIPEFLRNPVLLPENDLPNPQRKVTLLKDHTLDYPALCFQVFVAPDPTVRDDEARFARIFSRAGCRRAKSVLEADLVVFAGGSDVDPQLYGEKAHPQTHFNSKRDDHDMGLYLLCLEHGIPMVGVCRGAQFLHVMNGGKLFQHTDGHYGDHAMWDLLRKQHIDKISSVHHQMVRPNRENGMEIIATSSQSQERWVNDAHSFVGAHLDIEAFFYRDTCCVGVQGHPEYEGYNFYTVWFMKLLEELVSCNPDLYWDSNSSLRIRPEILAERGKIKRVEPEIQSIDDVIIVETTKGK